MRSLVPKDFYEEIKNKVAGQTFNIAYDKPGKVEDTFASFTKPSSKKFIKLIEKEIKN